MVAPARSPLCRARRRCRVKKIDLTRARLSDEPHGCVDFAKSASEPWVPPQLRVLDEHGVSRTAILRTGHAPGGDPMISVTIRSVIASFALSTTSDPLSI